MAKCEFTGLAPQFVVQDVVKTAVYYRDKLGFEVLGFFGEPPVDALLVQPALVQLRQIAPRCLEVQVEEPPGAGIGGFGGGRAKILLQVGEIAEIATDGRLAIPSAHAEGVLIFGEFR